MFAGFREEWFIEEIDDPPDSAELPQTQPPLKQHLASIK